MHGSAVSSMMMVMQPKTHTHTHPSLILSSSQPLHGSYTAMNSHVKKIFTREIIPPRINFMRTWHKLTYGYHTHWKQQACIELCAVNVIATKQCCHSSPPLLSVSKLPSFSFIYRKKMMKKMNTIIIWRPLHPNYRLLLLLLYLKRAEKEDKTFISVYRDKWADCNH